MLNPEKETFFEDMDSMHLALTFDDVRLATRANPDIPLPKQINLDSRFSKNIDLKLPFVSAAMNTVTESDMAIAMARLGGIGVIHSYLSVEEQKDEVRKVKYAMSGLIPNPVTVTAGRTLESVANEASDRKLKFDTFPVVDRDRRLVGVLTKKSFEYADSMSRRVGKVMVPEAEITKAPTGTTLDEAYKIMLKDQINTLPLVDPDNRLTGLYVWSDVKTLVRDDGGRHNLDNQNRLRVAIAVPTYDESLERVAEMSRYVDAVVLNSADGDSFYAFAMLEKFKNAFPDLDILVGNISDGESARLLAERGADGILVGQGPGSICTTRVETGIGKPQVTAIHDAVRAVDKFDTPIIGDGGISSHGDIAIALAAGAHAVMMGRFLAGTDETPGDLITLPNGVRAKAYNGMGSLKNIRASKRYHVNDNGTPLAEGVDSYEPYKGSVASVLDLCTQALVKSLRYVKAASIEEHRHETRLFRITNAGLRESHPHDLNIAR